MPQEKFDETFEVGTPANLVVNNIAGSVVITPGEDDKIIVQAVKYASQCNTEATLVEIFQEEDGTVVAKTTIPENRRFRNLRVCKVEFIIQVPKKSQVKAKCVSSDMTVGGLEGKFEFKTVSGDLNIKSLSGPIQAGTVSGDLDAEQLAGAGVIKSVSGDVYVKDSSLSPLRAESVSGRVIAETPISGEQDYFFKTVSGKIKVIAPQDTNCLVAAKSVSGNFKTSLPALQLNASRRRWKVKINQGGPLVTISTVSGNMDLVDSEDADTRSPKRVHSGEHRREVLQRIADGEIDVDAAISELDTA